MSVKVPVAAPFRSQHYTIDEIDEILKRLSNLIRISKDQPNVHVQYVRRANQWLDRRNEVATDLDN